MPVFQYSAVDSTGAQVKGTAFGKDFQGVTEELTRRGLSILELSVISDPSDTIALDQAVPTAPAGPDFSEVRPDEELQTQAASQSPEAISRAQSTSAPQPPPTEARSSFETQFTGRLVSVVPLPALLFFFRQLGTMLNAGINPADSLETLSRQTTSAKLASVLRETKDHIIVGRPISAGFQRYPEVFNPLMLSMIRVGEEGGFLSEQCVQLSEYIQRDIELRNMISRETAQPKITLGCSIFIIVAGNFIIQVLAPGGVGLPVPWLIWLVVAGIAVGSYFFVKLGLPQQHIRQRFDEFVLTIPGVGGMVMGFAMAKFGRAFGALYKGGVAMPRAIKLASDACGNEAIRAKVYPAVKSLEEGAGITDTLASTGAFSPIVLDMTRTGEMTGNMDEMLVKMAEFYEDEGETKARMAAKIIGVVCLLLVAIYVLYILITFYSGYFGRVSSAGETG